MKWTCLIAISLFFCLDIHINYVCKRFLRLLPLVTGWSGTFVVFHTNFLFRTTFILRWLLPSYSFIILRITLIFRCNENTSWWQAYLLLLSNINTRARNTILTLNNYLWATCILLRETLIIFHLSFAELLTLSHLGWRVRSSP